MTNIQAGSLSRRLPARTERVTFTWVDSAFSRFTEQWRAIRAKCRDPADKCWWCKRKFKDGEIIALAARGGTKKNVVLCTDCADKATA